LYSVTGVADAACGVSEDRLQNAMRWIHHATTPSRSIVVDVVAGVLTAMSVMAVSTTTPWWPHGSCGTGVNDPMQYALALSPFAVRCLLVRIATWPGQPPAGNGFDVMPKPPSDSPAA
jgi:hypothetical protein